MDQPLWQPSKERIARANMTAFAREVAEAHGEALPGLRPAQGVVGRASRAVLAGAVALCRGPGEPAVGPGADRRRPDARRQMVRRRRAQFRREPAQTPRRPARDRRLERGRAAARAELPRPVPGGREARRGAERAKASARAIGSPRSCRTRPRPSSPCWLPPRSARSGRPARPTSASRACSTGSARSSPRS